MNPQDRPFDPSAYEYYSTEQLKALLRQDLLADHDNLTEEGMLRIVRILQQRVSSLSEDEQKAQAAAAWRNFEEHYLPLAERGLSLYGAEPPPPVSTALRRRGWRERFPRGQAYIAGLLILILSSTVFVGHAYGYDVWDVLARWTSETFHFVADKKTNPQEDITTEWVAPEKADPRLKALYEEMKRLDLPTGLAPGRLPERFSQIGPIETFTGSYNGVAAAFLDRNEILVLSFEHRPEAEHDYAKDDSTVDTLEINGTTYYFMSNNKQKRVIWLVNAYECSIHGDISHTELEQMVRSIYERN